MGSVLTAKRERLTANLQKGGSKPADGVATLAVVGMLFSLAERCINNKNIPI